MVEVCSDWSYVGLVTEAWSAVSSPVGRAPHSWGVASSGAAYAGGRGGEEIARLQRFGVGSRVGFRVGNGTADVVIDGKEFLAVFTGLPLSSSVFPAVSNCRSPARYVLRAGDDEEKDAQQGRLQREEEETEEEPPDGGGSSGGCG